MLSKSGTHRRVCRDGSMKEQRVKIRVGLRGERMEAGWTLVREHMWQPLPKVGSEKIPTLCFCPLILSVPQATLNSEGLSCTHALHAWAGLGGPPLVWERSRGGWRGVSAGQTAVCHHSFSLKTPSGIM